MDKIMYNALASCHQIIHPPLLLQWLGSVFRHPPTLAASSISFVELQSYILPFSFLPHLPCHVLSASIPDFFSYLNTFLPSASILTQYICFCQTNFVFCLFDKKTSLWRRGGDTDDPKLSEDTCWMSSLTRRGARGGEHPLCRRED